VVIAPPRTEVDLGDAKATTASLRTSRPDVVYHLAALSSVARSWERPAEVLEQNVRATLHLLEAVRAEAPEAVVVMASSGEIYGPAEEVPTTETAPLRPQNPYAVSKAACDLLAGQYADAHGLRIIRARAFGHAGPGQGPTFAIASFTRQTAVGLASREQLIRLTTGNPHTRRDITDVRDVVGAYRALADRAGPGVYNVCSGRTASAADVLEILRDLAAPAELEHVVDEALLRPNETPEVRGSFERLAAATGWSPEIPLRQTIHDALMHWESVIRSY
jgi:GDP-4-dehydro-6-deoxy-D-mannose reductase